MRSTKLVLSVAVIIGALSFSLQADDVIKANNTDALNLGTSWDEGVVPGAGDIAVWDNTVTGANVTDLGDNLEWLGIRVLNPGGNVSINDENVLTLGAGGIDLSAATRNLSIHTAVAFGADQFWTAQGGRTLSLSGRYRWGGL